MAHEWYDEGEVIIEQGDGDGDSMFFLRHGAAVRRAPRSTLHGAGCSQPSSPVDQFAGARPATRRRPQVAERDGRVVKHYGAYGYFGELAMLSRSRRAATGPRLPRAVKRPQCFIFWVYTLHRCVCAFVCSSYLR